MNIQLTNNKRDAIFQSTLQLINEHGFHGTPMSLIAAHAQVATGTIYHYFPSKEVLLVELFKDCKTNLIKHVFDIDHSLAYKERFYLIWNRLTEFYLEHKDIFGFVEQFYVSPYFEITKGDAHQGYYGADCLNNFLKEGIAAGALKNYSSYAALSAFIGVAMAYIKNVIYGFSPINKQDQQDLIDIIWNGVKK